MIQAYSENNTNYSKNGDVVLLPTDCIINVTLGGSWTCSLAHSIDEGGRWSFLSEEAVIKAPSYNGEQLFRIRQRTKTDFEVTCTLEPIFFDSMQDNFLVDVRPTDKNGQQALNIMITNPKYSGTSDITTISTAYYEYKNLMEALQGSDDNSFVNRWGAELEFDNFTVKAKRRIGSDKGATARYGLNIDSIQETVDMSGVLTRIYPEGYNGRRHSSYVDSPIINQYPTIKTASRTYPHIMLAEDAPEEPDPGTVVCQNQTALNAALKAAVEADFAAGLDKPAVTLVVNMVDLRQTDLYKDFESLESVSLGDAVHLYHSRLGITSTERVVSLKYNACTESLEEITLGALAYDYFNQVNGDMTALISNSQDITGVAEQAAAAQSAADTAYQTATETSQYFNTDASGTNVLSDDDINLDAGGAVNVNGSAIASMAFEAVSNWTKLKVAETPFTQAADTQYELTVTGTVVFAALVSSTHRITGFSYTATGAVLYFDAALASGTVKYLYIEE